MVLKNKSRSKDPKSVRAKVELDADATIVVSSGEEDNIREDGIVRSPQDKVNPHDPMPVTDGKEEGRRATIGTIDREGIGKGSTVKGEPITD